MNELKTFAIFCSKDLPFGSSIYATGNSLCLGNWNPVKARELKYLEKNIWYLLVLVEFPFDLEFKLFINESLAPKLENIEPFMIKSVHLMPPSKAKEFSDIYIISFNIRFANPNDGMNVWKNRSKYVSGLILNYEPDILGLQEALMEQIDDLKGELGSVYEIYAVGRGGEAKKNETCAVFYKKERFLALDKGTFWLSETPDITQSMLEASRLPRICTWLRLFDFYNEKILYVFNTHLDHMTAKTRLRMTEILLGYMEKILMNMMGNVILMGDFNATSNEECIDLVTKKMSNSCYDDNMFTFHGWTGQNEGGRIDHIFYKDKKMGLKSFKVIRDSFEEKEIRRFPSDHFPIESIFTYKEKKN